MLFKRFNPEEILNNVVVTYPEYNLFIYDGKTYINNEKLNDGDFSNLEKHIPQGNVSLYELNINRNELGHNDEHDSDYGRAMIYPFITKDGARTAFRTISVSDFSDSSQFNFGDTISGSYPLAAGVTRIYVEPGQDVDLINFGNEGNYSEVEQNKKYIRSLKNVLNKKIYMSKYYAYESETWNRGTDELNMICIPSIMYGSSIKPGSIEMEVLSDGSLIAKLEDKNKNGELIETFGDNQGQVAGVVLYEEGFILLTATYSISNSLQEDYLGEGDDDIRWVYFGTGLPYVGKQFTNPASPTASFTLKFKGIHKIPTLTMFAHSERGEHNYSNNPFYFQQDQGSEYRTSETMIKEVPKIIKNTNKSPYKDHNAAHKNITYISKIGIYDEDKNLIAIAKLATPIKNTDKTDYTFKLKIDF